ncbi:MAG: FMN-binding protein [Spirochaetes bacterium]|nr:FMN-binding protein [Spirochaetota bacterium]
MGYPEAMNAMYRLPAVSLCIAFGLFFSYCSSAPVAGESYAGEKLVDGVYRGYYKKFPNNADVEVIVRNGRIEAVRVLFHGAWKGKGIEETMAQRIVDAQSTSVDAVTGATNSSTVIMNAADRALKKALSK